MPVGIAKANMPAVNTHPNMQTNLDVLGLRRKTVTGTAYTLTADDSGSVVIVNGSAAYTVTLPAAMDGFWCEVVNQADQNLVVSSATASTIVTFNNATASSITFSTGSHKIGRRVVVRSDGAKWFCSYDAMGTLPTIA